MLNEPESPRDEMLWKLAKKRARFKSSLVTYILMNIFFWLIWYFTENDHSLGVHHIPWPIWTTLGWGLGIGFQYAEAYVFPKSNSVEQEYEKLKGRQ